MQDCNRRIFCPLSSSLLLKPTQNQTQQTFFPVFPTCYSTMQHEGFRFSNVRSAARVAASKTSSTPSPVKDEHSRYFLAPIVAPVSLPSLGVTNRCDFFLISSIARGSSRRSFFNPTKIMGTPGHRSCDSSTHYHCIFD